jgi:cellulose synthase/poly-beta-1,6-N-acetylglucosamine synthase-like glycosyltransferase
LPVSEILEAVIIAAVVGFSIRRAVFLVAAMLRPRALPRPIALPSLTVLVPARNERVVAAGMLAALERLEYPAERLSFLLICDGCTDETPRLFGEWSAARRDTRVLELPVTRGKAAALNAGLRLAHGEIVVALDADLRPRPDFLLELVRPFADARVAASAGFLRPVNADVNVVTRYAAVTTWVHQLVTSAGTDRLGLNPPTFGAAAFRRTALEEMGGIPDVPAGEDVATSAGLTRRGWRTRFVHRAIADNIVVADLRNFWRQHVRWSRAVLRNHERTLPSRASMAQRVELAVASIGYGDRLAFVIASVGTLLDALPLWLPVLYLSLPALGIVVALYEAGAGRRLPRFLIATAVMFAIDVAASVSAVLIHAARRPYRWHSPRVEHLDGEANG